MIGRKGRDGTSGDAALPAGSDPTLTLLKTAASTGGAILLRLRFDECTKIAAVFCELSTSKNIKMRFFW